MHEAAAKKKKKKKKKCKSTQQKCGKQCIPLTDCCDGCGGGQTCNNGSCACPGDTIACGQECVTGSECCNAADCGGGGQSCVDGFCLCPDASDIPCGSGGCCDHASQVCAANQSTGARSCQAGGCPASDFCNDDVIYSCGPQCACLTSVNNRTVCSSLLGNCEQCTSDTQCTTDLDRPAVCIPVGGRCNCGPGVTRSCFVEGCSST